MKKTFILFTILGFFMLLIFDQLSGQDLQRSNYPSINFKKPMNNVSRPDPTVAARGAVFFQEGFESGNLTTNEWTLLDSDGDGNNWSISNTLTSHTGTYCAGSNSWKTDPLHPDNWIITKAIDLTNATGTIILEYWVRAQDQTWPNEYYGVYASTSGNTKSDFLGATGNKLIEEQMKAGSDVANKLYVKRSINISQYIGSKVYLAFRHFNCSDWFILDIDDISVFESTVVDCGIKSVDAPNNLASCNLGNDEPVTIELFNYGGVSLTGFNVSYTFDGKTVTEEFKDTIKPAQSFSYTFSKHINFDKLGYFPMNFTVSVPNDNDTANNSLDYNVSNTDANLRVVVESDNTSSQSWQIASSDGTVIASHSAYQWNITKTTKVCLLANDCYLFNYNGGGSNKITIYYNDEIIDQRTATGGYNIYSIGENCLPVNVLYLGTYIPDYEVTGNISLGGSFLNIGKEPITSFDIQYNINGTESAIDHVTNVNIPSGETFDFAHKDSYNFATPGDYKVDLKISNFNGTFTPDPNTFQHDLNILKYKPTARIFGEEATGTWCGWCPRGHVFMDYMKETYPDTWVGVAVHDNDPMAVTEYDTTMAHFISGYPSGLINRFSFNGSYDVDPTIFEDAYNLLKDKVVPADVNISSGSYNTTTRKLQYTLNTKFAGKIAKNFRVMGVIVENNVKGTATTYNQANYYSGGTTVMGGFESLPNPVPAAQMIYQNVARAILGSWNGFTGSFVNPTSDTTNYQYTFSYTLPTAYKASNIVVVGVLIDNETGQVMNVASKTLDATVGTNDEQQELVDFKVFPNPTSDIFNVDIQLPEKHNISIFVTDELGRMVKNIIANQDVIKGTFPIDISNLKNGFYLVNVKSEKGISVERIVKLK